MTRLAWVVLHGRRRIACKRPPAPVFAGKARACHVLSANTAQGACRFNEQAAQRVGGRRQAGAAAGGTGAWAAPPGTAGSSWRLRRPSLHTVHLQLPRSSHADRALSVVMHTQERHEAVARERAAHQRTQAAHAEVSERASELQALAERLGREGRTQQDALQVEG